MFDITAYMEEFTAAMRREFGERLVFVGLQGSFRRGEAKEGSDIDAVTVLDELCAMDLVRYDRAASALPERKRLCGFLSGRAELLNWERGDLFHFALDTQRVWGRNAAARAVGAMRPARRLGFWRVGDLPRLLPQPAARKEPGDLAGAFQAGISRV